MAMMKKIIITMLLFFPAVPVFAQPDPLNAVESMVNSVLEILDNSSLSLAEKKAQVSGRAQRFLSIESMSQRTLGTYWSSATQEQRDHFTYLFTRILEETYLNRIDDYSGGTVRYLQQRVKDDRAIVDTLIIADELQLPVQYRMVYEQQSWRVFDIVIDGVSLIMNYRASYAEIIRSQGYNGLFRLMEERVTGMSTS
ncbi:MlaC/ttg2D family ABC transporter substrate-binding protein [Pelovirga terrestris]|uniref:ABC transporter substrate-binding protein n=1 Tax=Pelovirga terrestris TaxID=2771352 RepID=A0A8J6UIT2_9BACT|nr:ABC transporter substrate-binding protein [Pelovirga terrestris]MBD1401670.1 ABC transporter substrate-binding protein [Pelovirga terrestris]